MKNTYELKVTVENDQIVIEGICPNCMKDDELIDFVNVLHVVFHEAWNVAKERNLYGEKKQGTKKKRQKDFRKSSRQNKED